MCQSCNGTGVTHKEDGAILSFIPCPCGIRRQTLNEFIAEVRAKIEEARNGANQRHHQSNIR